MYGIYCTEAWGLSAINTIHPSCLWHNYYIFLQCRFGTQQPFSPIFPATDYILLFICHVWQWYKVMMCPFLLNWSAHLILEPMTYFNCPRSLVFETMRQTLYNNIIYAHTMFVISHNLNITCGERKCTALWGEKWPATTASLLFNTPLEWYLSSDKLLSWLFKALLSSSPFVIPWTVCFSPPAPLAESAWYKYKSNLHNYNYVQ